jgi:phage terminase small subunit
MPKPSVRFKSGLTPKQEIFAYEYVTNGHRASLAAVKAGYKTRPSTIAYQNLQLDYVQKHIKKLEKKFRREAQARGDISDAREIMEGYTRDIRFDPRKLYDENKEIMEVPDLDDDTALSLVGIEVTDKFDETGTVVDRRTKYKFPDKNKVRDSLGQLLGLKNGNADVIKEIMEAIGMITVNVQNNYNQTNILKTDALKKAIGQSTEAKKIAADSDSK